MLSVGDHLPWLGRLPAKMASATDSLPPTAISEPASSSTTQQEPLLEGAGAIGDTDLDRALHRLQTFLAVVGFPCSPVRPCIVLSATVFVVLGVVLPAAASKLGRCRLESSKCELYEVPAFEVCALASEVSAAGVSLACVSWNLYKYDLRRFLFVDRQHGQANRFQKEYIAKIQDFFQFLTWWIIPCCLVKITREICRFIYISSISTWKSTFIFFVSIISWTYLSTVILASCALFNLVCNLQVIHFDDYGKLLEQDKAPLEYVQEHVRLRYYLSKISHRFRLFLLLLFLCVTTSLCVIVFLTTGYSVFVNFTNGGDIAISSVVQVVGIVLCLHAATKISRRAQGVASVASRWHAWVTCSTDYSFTRSSHSSDDLPSLPENFLSIEYPGSDLESSENSMAHTNTQLVSCMSSYNKRESFLLYLMSTPGGITIFGWTIDRPLLITILMLELTLVLFVLGKTFVVPPKT